MNNIGLGFASEQQLTDCTYTGWDGCEGGAYEDCWDYLSTTGLETNASYPWRAATTVFKLTQFVIQVSSMLIVEILAVISPHSMVLVRIIPRPSPPRCRRPTPSCRPRTTSRRLCSPTAQSPFLFLSTTTLLNTGKISMKMIGNRLPNIDCLHEPLFRFGSVFSC